MGTYSQSVSTCGSSLNITPRKMQAFVLVALVPLVSALPSSPYHPAPSYGHPAPAYGHAAPAYAHHAPAYGHSYEHPKHNCSVQDVVEPAEVCVPAFETVCNPVELTRKSIVDKEQCYTVTRTVCSESIEEIDNEICTYSYQPKTETTTAKTVEVTFNKECKTQMVTVCQPAGYGGYGQGYGHNYCKEVAQETCYNVPVVTPVQPSVDVTYPEPIETCVNKPISLPRISCENLVENRCITVPEVEKVTDSVDLCETRLGRPACQDVELTLPQQECVEMVYGVSHDKYEEPTYEETKYEEEPNYEEVPQYEESAGTE